MGAALGAALQRQDYKSNTVTEVKEYPGPHLLPSRDGWEEVADDALEWAVSHAREGNARQAPPAV